MTIIPESQAFDQRTLTLLLIPTKTSVTGRERKPIFDQMLSIGRILIRSCMLQAGAHGPVHTPPLDH